jgi:hypothetical protein
MRQLGVTHCLYDRLRAVGRGEQLERLLPPDRALARWARWWRAHASLTYESPAFDPAQGAYELFEFVPRARGPAPCFVLPGVEGWLWRAERLRRAGDAAEAYAVFDRIEAASGDVALVRQARVAIFESDLPHAEVRRRLEAVDALGFRSVWLLTTLARLAAEAGEGAAAATYRRRADALTWKP